MAKPNLDDPRRQEVFAALEKIGDRVEKGEITPEQACAEGDKLILELNRQLAADAEAGMAEQAQLRRRNASAVFGVVLLAVAAMVAYRYLL